MNGPTPVVKANQGMSCSPQISGAPDVYTYTAGRSREKQDWPFWPSLPHFVIPQRRVCWPIISDNTQDLSGQG